MPDSSTLFIILALILILPAHYRLGRQPPAPNPPPFCAWCKRRDQEDCTHPDSPVYGRSCGPVCTGKVPCNVREVRHP